MSYIVYKEGSPVAPVMFATFEQAKDCLRGTLLLHAAQSNPAEASALRMSEEIVKTWEFPSSVTAGFVRYEIQDVEN